MDKKNVVIVGATGAVGKAIIKTLDNLEFPVGELRLVASERSAGKVVKTSFGDIKLEIISDEVFEASDIAIFAAGGDISREWRDRVVAADC